MIKYSGEFNGCSVAVYHHISHGPVYFFFDTMDWHYMLEGGGSAPYFGESL